MLKIQDTTNYPNFVAQTYTCIKTLAAANVAHMQLLLEHSTIKWSIGMKAQTLLSKEQIDANYDIAIFSNF